MMLGNKTLFLLLLSLGCLLGLPPRFMLAQASHTITINHHVATPGDENTGVDVFFTIGDENGRFVPEPDIKSATIQLLGDNSDPVPVTITKPETPIFIALLLDTSGSMSDVMDQVRTAAKSAIDSAPSTAHFAVIPFNETSSPAIEFTNNHLRVKDVIDSLDAIPNQGTCLYDAVYDAVGRLEEQISSPAERRAIILFTDGQDRLKVDDPKPCSHHTYSEVISRAKPQNANSTLTPIHTIGLYSQSVDELNVGELSNMAAETDAFSAVGNQANLGDLFQEIIDGLNSQLVAHGQVFAREGENPVVLSLQLSNDNVSLAAPFTFFSPRTDKKPSPAVAIQVNSLSYDKNTNHYALALAIKNPASIHQLIVTIWDQSNIQVDEQKITNPSDTASIALDGNLLEGNEEYTIHIQAVNIVEELMPNEEGEVLLAEHPFLHDPTSLAPPVKFTIQAVTADFENGLFYIDLDVPEAERVQTYEGFIRDGKSGGKIHDFGPADFTGSRIQQPLPDAIRLAGQTQNYPVTVYLTTTNGQRSESSYDDFEPTPPKPPTFWERVGAALQENPLYLLPIVIIIVSLAGHFYLQNRKRKQDEPDIARPPIDKSIIISSFDRAPLLSNPNASSDESDFLHSVRTPPAAKIEDKPPVVQTSRKRPEVATAVRLQLRVIQRDTKTPQPEKIITTFPLVIGREDCGLIIDNDPRISRQHVQILLRDKKLFVEDLGGRNGTFLEKTQLPPKQPVPLGQNKIIRLTSRTYLEVEQL